jgi:hypothetical protein
MPDRPPRHSYRGNPDNSSLTFGYLAGYLRVLYNVTSNNADLGNGADGAGDCNPQPLFFDRLLSRLNLPRVPCIYAKGIRLNKSFVQIIEHNFFLSSPRALEARTSMGE